MVPKSARLTFLVIHGVVCKWPRGYLFRKWVPPNHDIMFDGLSVTSPALDEESTSPILATVCCLSPMIE